MERENPSSEENLEMYIKDFAALMKIDTEQKLSAKDVLIHIYATLNGYIPKPNSTK